jgi:DNA-binding transcriptional LysR family regulator
MDVRQLRYFVAVAEELHFGRAATRLRIAQPALSQQIRTLERELALQLLERTNRGVVLTDAGARLVAEARSVLERFDEAVEVMRRVRAGSVGSVRVGVFPGPLRTVLPPVLVELRRQRPDVEVETRFVPAHEQPIALLDARLDLALMPSLGQAGVAPPLAEKVVSRELLGIAVPAAHPLARKRLLGAKDLAGLPFVFMARDSGPDVYDTVLAALRAAGVRPRSMLESSTPESSLSIVAAGLAASVKTQSEVAAARAAGERVVWKRLSKFDLELSIVAAWDTRRVTAPLGLLLELLDDKPPFSPEKEPVLDAASAPRLTARDDETRGGSDAG